MIFSAGEFILMVMNAVVLITAQDEAIVSPPAIGVNGGLGKHLPLDDRLQLCNGVKITDSDAKFPAAADEPAVMLITAAGTESAGEELEVRIAFDANKNAQIDSAETPVVIEVLKNANGESLPPKIKGLSMSVIADATSTIQGRAWGQLIGDDWWKNWAGGIFVPSAQSMLRIFYDAHSNDLASAYKPTTILPVAPIDAFGPPGDFSEWYTHHTGAPFSAGGQAKLNYHYWQDDHSIAELIEGGAPLVSLKGHSSIVAQLGSDTNQSVEDLKQIAVPIGTERVFPNPAGYDLQTVLGTFGKPLHWSPLWVSKQSPTIGNPDGYDAGAFTIPDDAFGTFGRVRSTNGRYWCVVRKENRSEYIIDSPDGAGHNEPYTAVVVYFRIKGNANDLYDFNLNPPGIGVTAAAVQLGYGNGTYTDRNRGVVYRTSVDILRDYEVKQVRLP